MNNSNALRPLKPHQIYEPPVANDGGLSRYIGISIALHLAILTIFTVRGIFFPGEPLMLERAIRVDIVGLPEKRKELPKQAPPAEVTKPEAKQPEPAPAPEPVKPPEPKPAPPVVKPALPPPKPVAPKPDANKINLNKTKSAQESALKRLEALKRIENMVGEAKPAKPSAPAASAPVRGNEISKGSDLTGISKLENDNYLTTLDQHVKRHWDVPNFLARAKLSASAIVYLDENGNVTKKVLVRSSGNEIFDETVMNSIANASPFPVPPKRLVNLFMTEGIQLGFPD